MSPPRPPREEDLPEIVRLMSANWPEPIDEESVRRDWTAPGVDLALDARLEPGAYVFVESFGDERVWIDVRGEPSQELLDWAEARAAKVGSRLLSGAWSSSPDVLRELERRGFGLVRHSLRMQIDLAGEIPSPEWPDGIEVRTYRDGDARLFYDLEQETFADSWEPDNDTFEEWSHWLLQPPAFVPDLWFLAHVNGEPAGFSVCHPRPASVALGWVRLLGVRRPWRRRGLGRALLLHAFSEFRARGFERVGLGVDATSLTGANVLYDRVGMHVAARFEIYEKVAA